MLGWKELRTFCILFAVTRRPTNRQQTKNQLKLGTKRFRAVKPYFGPQNVFNCIFSEHRNCDLSLMKLCKK